MAVTGEVIPGFLQGNHTLLSHTRLETNLLQLLPPLPGSDGRRGNGNGGGEVEVMPVRDDVEVMLVGLRCWWRGGCGDTGGCEVKVMLL